MRNLVRVLTSCVVAAAFVVAPAQSDAAPAPAPAATHAARVAPSVARTTTLVIRLHGCRTSCGISLAVGYKGLYWRKLATSHTATTYVFKNVPVSYTRGMSFEFSDSAEGFTDAVDNVVVRYRGTTPGKRYTVAATRKLHSASGCWAGTTRSKVVLDVNVAWMREPSFTNPAVSMWVTRTYFSPVLTQIGGYMSTPDGSLGNQEIFYC
jgi:hypothetical protein